MAKIICLWGPPCAGKSTAAKMMRQPGDVFIERDTMHQALTGLPTHNHTKAGMAVVNAGFKAMLDRAQEVPGRFIFVTGGQDLARRQPFIDAGAEMRLIYADRQTCLERASTERPKDWTAYIDRWFNTYEAEAGLTPGTLI
jgi:hypothetical protein